ncbi:MAG: hypothetical protein BroJett014_26560 [Planctomycetota bacterium]|nr:MAG: hypothetical protein BroJett014_26560 [Planctomycetota bacterium]
MVGVPLSTQQAHAGGLARAVGDGIHDFLAPALTEVRHAFNGWHGSFPVARHEVWPLSRGTFKSLCKMPQ